MKNECINNGNTLTMSTPFTGYSWVFFCSLSYHYYYHHHFMDTILTRGFFFPFAVCFFFLFVFLCDGFSRIHGIHLIVRFIFIWWNRGEDSICGNEEIKKKKTMLELRNGTAFHMLTELLYLFFFFVRPSLIPNLIEILLLLFLIIFIPSHTVCAMWMRVPTIENNFHLVTLVVCPFFFFFWFSFGGMENKAHMVFSVRLFW